MTEDITIPAQVDPHIKKNRYNIKSIVTFAGIVVIR